MTIITGLFATQGDADNAVNSLIRAGVTKADLSIILSGATRENFSKLNPKKKEHAYNSESGGHAAIAGVEGAAIGGALGALLASLTAVGTIAVPGGLLVAGPLVAALSGASVGAAVGGLGTALVRAGLDEHEAGKYEGALKAGNAIIVVNTTDDAKLATVRRILNPPMSGRNMNGEITSEITAASAQRKRSEW